LQGNFGKRALHNHVNKEHKAEAASVWSSCDLCGLLLPKRKNLSNHFNNVHRNQLKARSDANGEGIDFMKLHFGQKTFWTNFYPNIL
jgi:hypothetical protein